MNSTAKNFGKFGGGALASAIALGLAATTSQAGHVVNGDFSVSERAFVLQSETDADQCESAFDDMCEGQLDSLPGWVILDLGEQFILTDISAFDYLDAYQDTVVRFSENDNALSGDDDAIAQCVDLSTVNVQGADFSLSVNATTQFPRATDGIGELPVELAVKFYSETDCAGELNEDIDLFDDVVDLADGAQVHFQRFDLVSSGTAVENHVQALVIEPWEWATAILEGAADEEYQSVAIFIGAGDQTDDGSEPTGPRQSYLDHVVLSIDGINDGDNLLVNGDFDQLPGDLERDAFFSVRTPWPDDDQGPFGWMLSDLQSDGGAATEAVPNEDRGLNFDAVVGNRVFKFRGIDDISSGDPSDANDDNLDQCVDIRDLDGEFSYSAYLRSNEGQRLDVALMYEFHEDWDSCLTRINSTLDNDDPLENNSDTDQIFQADTWELFETVPVTPGAGDNFVRLSIRVVDALDSQDPDLRVFIDDVRINRQDDDDDDSNGDDGDEGDSGSEGSSSSGSGCVMGNGNGFKDPSLPLLVLFAAGLFARRVLTRN